ncbi:cation:proton antiporter [Pedobacter sp.]|uniref:cation:proton antiporter domain-containing protein n=1 Tax=Pedobacter sp. TaxID=1411316 RepID=UPI003C4F9752
MEIKLIVTICVLILVGYVFDITSRHTKVPSVIFLMVLGWIVRNFTADLNLMNLSVLLPIFGTIGLVLIVLEGGLELEINSKKRQLITRSIWSAFLPITILCLLLGLGINFHTGAGLKASLLNAVPFCIISSAIAIPAVHNFDKKLKEMVIYESSMSDIIGVIVFNFLISNEIIQMSSFLAFGLQIIIMIIISLIASLCLAFLIKKIDHHVKLIPIMIMVVMIYAIAKIYHLPALMFILIFGLFLNNLDELKNMTLIKNLEPKKLDMEVHRFARLVSEMAFLIRTVFFILFGYTITLDKLLNVGTIGYSLLIFVIIIFIRWIQLKLSGEKINPSLFIAPRGLITVMLFISIPIHNHITLISESMIIQVIVISIIVMTAGMLFYTNPNSEKNRSINLLNLDTKP